MKRFERVAVLMGGDSSEREVSLRSGAAVARGLREAGYRVTEVDVHEPLLDLPAGIEAVFIAMHGAYGEDGGVQHALARLGMPFTGSDSAASRRAFDKIESKLAFAAAGVPTPTYAVIESGQPCPLPLPVVVKPVCEGSSIGVHVVRQPEEWAPALEDALCHGRRALVETYIPGRELTVGIVDGTVLPVVEIVAPGGWYGYDVKYTAGACRYQVPAPLEARVANESARLGLACFQALGCRGLGRVDMRLTPDGDLFVLELNAIPGFTETSLLPKAAAAAGIAFPALCARIMETAALERI